MKYLKYSFCFSVNSHLIIISPLFYIITYIII
nr:MAG TPA: hypothetical protein [Caudoviricetes sp.]